VTPEPAGGNCPEGGLKVEIISGVDDTTVKDTQYVCNGEQGPQGIQGIQGPAGNDGADGTNGTDGQGIDHVSTYQELLEMAHLELQTHTLFGEM
jgi:hypothetical protein